MKRLSATTRKMTQGFLSLSQRERVILSLAAVALLFVAGQEVASSVENSIDETRRQVQVRTQQLKDLERALTRYTSLKQRRDTLQASFAQSQMSFEQVTNELDRIVRTAIGSDNYELKKPNPPTPFGFEYEKQDFTLIIKTLSLQQLVTLLHEIEHGARPLYLSKVDVTKALAGTDFGAVIEIYSIAKTTKAAKDDESLGDATSN